MRRLFFEAFERLQKGKSIMDLARPIIREVDSGSQSYQPTWHALGFIHCKLADFEAGQLRLHIWPAGKRHNLEQDMKIHEHLFTVNSCVVRGELQNVNYEFAEVFGPIEAEFQRYSVEYLRNGSRLNSARRYFKIVKVSEESVRRGEFYRVKRGMFHETKTDRYQQVVTLVATSEIENRSPFMMGEVLQFQSKFRQRVICERVDFLKEISEVLSGLDE